MVVLSKKFYWILLTSIFQIAAPGAGLECVQCTSELNPRCIDDPGEAQACNDDQKYCIVIKEYIKNSTTSIFSPRSMEGVIPDSESARGRIVNNPPPSTASKQPHWLSKEQLQGEKDKKPGQRLVFVGRSCVNYFGGTECQDGTKDGQVVTVCKEYCTDDGCNPACRCHMEPALIALASFLVLLLAANINRA